MCVYDKCFDISINTLHRCVHIRFSDARNGFVEWFNGNGVACVARKIIVYYHDLSMAVHILDVSCVHPAPTKTASQTYWKRYHNFASEAAAAVMGMGMLAAAAVVTATAATTTAAKCTTRQQ